jgi:hypothetical protein
VALAIRIEREFLGNPEERDCTDDRFFMMVDNLGLTNATDEHFSDDIYEKVVVTLANFMDRKYEYNGKGGLFPLKFPRKDQRFVEIWYQLNAVLIEDFM